MKKDNSIHIISEKGLQVNNAKFFSVTLEGEKEDNITFFKNGKSHECLEKLNHIFIFAWFKKLAESGNIPWKSKVACDGTKLEGVFHMGVHLVNKHWGWNITFEFLIDSKDLRLNFWDVSDFAKEIPESNSHPNDFTEEEFRSFINWVCEYEE